MAVSITTKVVSGLNALMGRTFANRSMAYDNADNGLDPYDPAPTDNERASEMFHLDAVAPWTPENEMRESEKRELDSMAMIRGALYPAA